ncbi:MAG: thioredoxin family protein [Pirellulales bacterium]
MVRCIWRTVVIVGLLSLVVGHAEAKTWLSDLDEGKRQARAQGKDLLINFTGTEWCGACVDFDAKVLKQPGFLPARDLFVLVNLEYPPAENLPAALRKKYDAWKVEYGIQLYPTPLLADATGRPYACAGYDAEVKPEQYVQSLRKLRQIHDRRDTALANAAKAKDAAKARYLNEALSAIQGAFYQESVEGQGDPLVRFYRAEIDNILALDAGNAARLHEKYRGLLEAEAERRRVKDIDDRARAAFREKGADAALGIVDQELARPQSVALRKRWQLSRFFYLGRGNRHEEACAFAEELLKDRAFSPDERRSLRQQIAFHYRQLGRIDDALTIYDGLIAEVAGNPAAMRGYLDAKAWDLSFAGRFAEALKVRDAIDKFTKAGTSEWVDNGSFRAILLTRLGRHADAVAAYETLLKCDTLDPLTRANLLTKTAVSLNKQGRRDQAMEKTSQAEKLLAGVKADEINRSDTSFLSTIQKELKDARGATESKDKSPDKR